MPGRFALRRLTLACAAAASFGSPRLFAQAELADLREDVRGLTQRLSELSLRVEQLEHENAELKAEVAALGKNGDSVTPAQLNGAVADLNAAIKASVASARTFESGLHAGLAHFHVTDNILQHYDGVVDHETHRQRERH